MAGACEKGGYMQEERSIVVYEWYWDTATELEKAALMTHEKGHCVYDFSHDIKIPLDDGCVASILNEQLPTHLCLDAHWNYYQADMMAKYAAKLAVDPTPVVRSEDYVDESVANMF